MNHQTQTRPAQLTGPTYKAKVDKWDKPNMYITVNEHRGIPFEIFVRQDNPELYEWVTAVTVLVTRLLREGVSLPVIARELQEIHSPVSDHYIKGGTHCPSIPARIGRVLEIHSKRRT